MKYFLFVSLILFCIYVPLTGSQCQRIARLHYTIPDRCLQLNSFQTGPDLNTASSTKFDDRMKAAELHYASGCILSALKMCAAFNVRSDFNRMLCYQDMEPFCLDSALKYKIWLKNGK